MNKKFTCRLLRVLLMVSGTGFVTSCDLLNCTEYSSILFSMQICSPQGEDVALSDTLTITAAGTDQILLNKQLGASLIQIPLSYTAQTDTFYLNIKGRSE